MSVADKVVIVTGAAGGIGQEYATGLAAQGARIVAADIADCAATVAAVRGAGGRIEAVRSTSPMPGRRRRWTQAAVDAFGRIDALINNAALYGALHGGRFDAIPRGRVGRGDGGQRQGHLALLQGGGPAMRKTGGGSIVNIASLAATYGTPFALHYTTSKAAVIGLHARPRPRARARQHQGERGGAECGDDRGHARASSATSWTARSTWCAPCRRSSAPWSRPISWAPSRG